MRFAQSNSTENRSFTQRERRAERKGCKPIRTSRTGRIIFTTSRVVEARSEPGTPPDASACRKLQNQRSRNMRASSYLRRSANAVPAVHRAPSRSRKASLFRSVPAALTPWFLSVRGGCTHPQLFSLQSAGARPPLPGRARTLPAPEVGGQVEGTRARFRTVKAINYNYFS